MWVLLICFVFILLFLDYLSHNSKDGKMFDKIPGLKPWPIIGNVLDFLYGPVPLFYYSRSMANKFKKLYRTWIIQGRVVNLHRPNDMEVILSSQKHIKKGFIYDFIHPWLNDGLLTSTGEKWQKRRKILTPAFHFNILRQFCKVFDEQSRSLVEDLKLEIGKPETNIIPFMTKFALNSICETAMGTRIDSETNSSVASYKKSIHNLGKLLVHRLTRAWLYNPYIFNLSPYGKQQRQELSFLHKFTIDVIRKRREDRKVFKSDFLTVDDNIDNDDGGVMKKKRRMAMLDLLLSAEEDKHIDENGIREEVDTFMFEGHDTTSMALTFCLMLLANNPQAQELIVAECNEIIEDPSREVTMEDLNRMRYLEKCLKEALRLYPSVPFIARQCDEEVQLDGYTVPANTAFNLHIFDMHRNAELFPNPDVFDPERFTVENCAKRHPFAYIPFSAGPRNCIGQKFALLEEKSIVSAILRNFKLEPITTPDDITFTADMVLRSKYPIKIKFLPR